VEHARRLYGLVYPRDTRIVRLVVFALSLLRKPVRGFIHPVDTIERVVRDNGLNPTSLEESDACGRLIIASLCVPPAR
jgi:hypothetical protein